MKAFLQKSDGDWFDDYVYITNYQLKNMGADIISFDGDSMRTVNEAFNRHSPKRGDIIVGSVDTTEKFFERIGVEVPKYLGYPEGLEKYLYRNIKTVRFGDIDRHPPYFIKPKDGVKLFTGAHIEKPEHLESLRKFDNVPDDLEVYMSDSMNFLSEFRCFVHKGQPVGIQYYRGDFMRYINTYWLYDMIRDYKDAPIAYTLDLGVNETGNTALIEVNDMWAIASYGLDAKTYTRMVIDRQLEICGIKI